MTEEKEANELEEQSRRRRSPRGRVTVFPNWCKSCNLCIDFCPVDVLERGEDGRVVVADPERCTGCQWCELHCPDFAIFVSDVAENHEQAVQEEETA